VIASVIKDLAQIAALEKTGKEFDLAIAELGTAAKAVGAYMQWVPSK